MRSVHARLRDALRATRAALDDGEPAEAATRDLLLYCHGFCVALTEHHVGEERLLFPAIAAAHPELADTLRYLSQDHSMIDHLVGGLQTATERAAPRSEIDQHLEGIAAIMKSHFGYEERQLLSVLDTLALNADPHDVLGPL
nr:hemerythrin domain-containing protein [Ornithinimicrobium sp. HY1793]